MDTFLWDRNQIDQTSVESIFSGIGWRKVPTCRKSEQMMHSWRSSFGTAQKYSSHLFLHIWVESFQTIWHVSCLICVSPFSNVLCLMSNVLWTSNFKFHFHVTLYITSDTAHFEKLSLRGCKFSLERSKEKLDFHFTVGWAFWKVTTDHFLKSDHWPLFEKWPLTSVKWYCRCEEVFPLGLTSGTQDRF